LTTDREKGRAPDSKDSGPPWAALLRVHHAQQKENGKVRLLHSGLQRFALWGWLASPPTLLVEVE